MKATFLLIFFFMSFLGIAQDSNPKEKTAEKKKELPVGEVMPVNNVSVEKAALPVNQKNSPEVFYVINDKPVTQEEYLRHLKAIAKKQ